MLQNSAEKTASSRAKPPLLPVDEELWFGTNDDGAAERAAVASMAATVGQIVGAKHLPESALKLAELSKNESTPLQEFVRVIEQDPGLSAQLLRLVNSSGFALRQRCTTVRHAVTLIGSKHLYRLATTAAVLDLFDSESKDAVAVLRHSAVMGSLCRYLGAHVGMAPEELFTIGALHDIGKLMMLDAFGERYQVLTERSLGAADTVHAFERAEFGFDHGVLAAHVFKAWAIPQPIPKIVAWHHAPARAYAASSPYVAHVQLLRLADSLAHALEQGATQVDIPRLARHDGAAYLDISEAQLAAMWEELARLHVQALESHEGPAGVTVERESHAQRDPAAPAPVLPKQFPCVECDQPSFGFTCPACKGFLCPEHASRASDWCRLCTRKYQDQAGGAPFPFDGERGAVVVTALVFALTLALWRAAEPEAVLGGIVAAVLLSSLGTALVLIGRRSYLRARFLRTSSASTGPSADPP